MEHRNERLSTLFRDKLSQFILEDIETGDAMITVTEVQLSQKKDRATALVSILPESEEERLMKELNRRVKAFAYRLLKSTRIRITPHLMFKVDRGLANAVNVESILDRLDLPSEGDDR